MPKKELTDMGPLTVGVINPYALAEVLLKHSVDWAEVDPHKVLAEVFAMPYAKLFDPINNSPLYAGLVLNRQTMVMEQVPPASLEVRGVAVPGAEADAPLVTDADTEPEGPTVAQAMAAVEATAVWADPGVFFNEAVEVNDAVQGALGDCYFVAALASVAWARTYEIAQRTRATGLRQPEFVDMVPFWDYSGKLARVEVTELLPLNPPTNSYIYCRSSEPGEIWPAVYEKAYAKWRTNDTGDRPNYGPLAGGDPVGACAQLTGLKRHYCATASMSAHDIWQTVRGSCLSMKTFNPMVAWTYPTGDKSPDKVNYNNAHLVANHAYSILGWDYRNNREYVILRNPWGGTEATLDTLAGQWSAWDAPYYGGPGWWRPTQMATLDGIFGIAVDTFRKYFAAFGWVAET